MSNQAFGAFVRVLRKEKEYRVAGDVRQWRQEDLARAANLAPRQIARIEQGQVANLKPYLDRLSTGLGLSEIQKADFYAKAGFAYTPKRISPSPDILRTWLAQLHHPASIRTPLWDFVAFNEYHRLVRGYARETIQALDEGPLGPNLLRVLFDPQFADRTDVRDDSWAVETVWAFRAASFKYIETRRYALIRNEMDGFDEFRSAWIQSDNLLSSTASKYKSNPYVRVDLGTGIGEIEFMSLRIPDRYIGPETIISVYVPLATSESKYQRFREGVRNQVYFFREEPLE